MVNLTRVTENCFAGLRMKLFVVERTSRSLSAGTPLFKRPLATASTADAQCP